MSSLSIRQVRKRFGKIEVLHGLDLEVEHNEFLVMVGPSGCGKSTMLRLIAGLEDVTEGEIWIGDRLVNNVEPKNRNIAMVFQNYALYPHMTVYRNIAFGLRAARVPKTEIDTKVREAAAILGLEDLLERKPAELSGGQRQRVSMGRAIVRDPQVFLFDEPLSNLDAKLRGQMRTEIKRLHQRVETTIVYVTHDQIEAMTLADRMVVMRDGYIQQIGTPLEVFQHPANVFVAGFIGSPAMNLVPGPVVTFDGGLAIQLAPDTALPVSPELAQRLSPGQRIIAGIRPDDLTPAGADRRPRQWRTEADVRVVEPMGTESVLVLDLAGHELVGKAPGRQLLPLGPMTFDVDLEQLHLFDEATGQAISAQ